MENGDALTGVDALDEAFSDATFALQKRKPSTALDHLFAALDAGAEVDQPYTINIIQGLFALLGKNHKLTQEYESKLVV